MMKVSFAVPEPAMARTVYYELFSDAVRRNPRFVEDPAMADICLPAEDTAVETNWPRFGDQTSAYIRGGYDGEQLNALSCSSPPSHVSTQ